MSDAPRIAYYPRGDATPQTEAAALAAVYRFLLFDYDNGDAAGCDQHRDGDEAKKGSKHEVRPTDIIQR